MSRPIPPPQIWRDADEEAAFDRLWAALVLATTLPVCRSICDGRPVLARQLDAKVLRRALRGAPFPSPDSYKQITAEMLDAIAEGGPFL
jgi:hypothetical protein